MTQDWGPGNQLVVDGKISSLWLAKQGRGFGLIITVYIDGSFQSAMHNISECNASYPLPLANVNHHIGKGLGC